MVIKEYKEKSQKVVTTKNGFAFTIKKISVSTMLELLDVYQGKQQPSEQDLPKVMKVLIPKCVVEPKIVTGVPKENEMSFDDLNVEDAFELLEAISNYSGVTGPLPKDVKQ